MIHLLRVIGCSCLFVASLLALIVGGQSLRAAEPAAAQTEVPAYVDVFVGGKEYPSFRIPSIVVSQKETLMAFAEGRAMHHDHAANDIVLKRSGDGGKTWGRLMVVADDGDNSLNNPQAVVVPKSGRILMMYQRYPHGAHESQVVPGHNGPKICRNFVTHSDDDGLTWSAPLDVTASTKRPEEVTSIAGGPGIGIVLERGKHAGRIIMPFNEGPAGRWKVYAVYSDDGGETWNYGGTAPNGSERGVGNEVQMVELTDGAILLNTRVQGGNKLRKVATSRDGGLTWSALAEHAELSDPECQGSILRYDWPAENRPGHLLFSNAANSKARNTGTIKVSDDEGQTWKKAKTVHAGDFAYSCLVKCPEGDVGLLFERDGYRAVSFLRMPASLLFSR